MSRFTIVQYETAPDRAQENRQLVEDVFAELSATAPDGLRYAAFQLADGVTFVHVVTVEGESDPLASIEAFGRFQKGIGERVTGPPRFEEAELVGEYRFTG
jgi:hypothetical protein